jgi:hypothetical protein
MNAVRQVIRAWPLVIAIWLVEIAIAATAAFALRTHVAAALDDFVLPDHHVLYAAAELGSWHPQLLVAALVGVMLSGLLGLVVWSLVAPAVLLRLHGGPQPAAQLGARWLTVLPGALATTAWHGGLRVLIVLVVGSTLGGVGGPALPIALLVAWALATCALDLSRVGVVVHDARGVHPGTALLGYLQAFKRPRVLAASLLLQLLAWGAAGLGVWALVQGGGNAIGATRACALLAVALGLVRHAVSLTAGPLPVRPADAPT